MAHIKNSSANDSRIVRKRTNNGSNIKNSNSNSSISKISLLGLSYMQTPGIKPNNSSFHFLSHHPYLNPIYTLQSLYHPYIVLV